MRFLKNMDAEAGETDGTGEAGKRKRAQAKPELKRKALRKGGETKIILENGEKSSPDKAEDEQTPEKEARVRLKAGKGKGKGKSKAGGDGLGAESEEEDDDAATSQVQAWEADLKARIDGQHPDQLVTAFSIKPCPPSAIRNLTADCFLGKKRP